MAKPGGLLYAIRAEGTSLVKIGYTTGSVEKRLRAMQTGQPFPLRVIATYPIEDDVRQKEAWLHAFLTQNRRLGEWFEMTLDTDEFADLIARATAFGQEQEARRQEEKAQKERERHLRALTVIGRRVRQERERLHLSRDELVQQMPETLRMDRNTLWHIEAGRTKNPRADQLMALAHVLGVSTDYLLGLSDAPQARKRRARTADVPVRLTPGLWKGQVWIAPDFDETDEDLIRAFEGEE